MLALRLSHRACCVAALALQPSAPSPERLFWGYLCPWHSPDPERALPRKERAKPFFAVVVGCRTSFPGTLPVWVGGKAGDGHPDMEALFRLLFALRRGPTAVTAGSQGADIVGGRQYGGISSLEH